MIIRALLNQYGSRNQRFPFFYIFHLFFIANYLFLRSHPRIIRTQFFWQCYLRSLKLLNRLSERKCDHEAAPISWFLIRPPLVADRLLGFRIEFLNVDCRFHVLLHVSFSFCTARGTAAGSSFPVRPTEGISAVSISVERISESNTRFLTVRDCVAATGYMKIYWN